MDILINDILPTPSVTDTLRPVEKDVAVMKKALDLQKTEGQALVDMVSRITQKGQTINLTV